jgi:autotransporter-associated beta strand protein
MGLSLNNLAIDQEYHVQVWLRNQYGGTDTTYDGAVSLSVAGQYAMGTFTADAESQAISLTAENIMINAMQLRTGPAPAYPPPSPGWNMAVSGDWNVADNWIPVAVPTDTAIFGNNVAGDVVVNVDEVEGGTSINKIVFDKTDGKYTISGTTLTLAGDTPTIQVKNGSHEISAPLAGTAGLAKTDVGELILSGDNSGLSGGVTVSAGTLGIGSDNALGTNLLTVNGTIRAVGAARTIGNDAVMGGTVGGDQDIEFSGTVTGGVVYVTNSAQTTFSGDILPDGGGWNMSFTNPAGAGLTTISGTVGKNTPVSMGIFGLNYPAATGPSDIAIKGPVNVAGWNEVSYYWGTITISDAGSITINDDGLFYLGAARGDNHFVLATDDAIVETDPDAGWFCVAGNDIGYTWSIDAVGAARTINGSVYFEAPAVFSGDQPLKIAGKVLLGWGWGMQTPFIVNNLAGPVTIEGAIEDAYSSDPENPEANPENIGGITKRGPGELILTGDNTYGGDTIVDEGTLKITTDTPWLSDTAAVKIAAGALMNLDWSDSLTDIVGAVWLGGTKVYGTINYSTYPDYFVDNTGSLFVQGYGTYWAPGLLGGQGGTTERWSSTVVKWAMEPSVQGIYPQDTTGTLTFTDDASGTVYVDGPVTASAGLAFQSDGYNLAAGDSIEGNAPVINLTGATAAANTITVGPALTATIGVPLAVANGITKAGDGTLVLSAANTYAAPTTVNAGTLKAGVASEAGVSGAFGNNSAVTMANVATAVLDIAGFDTQIGSLAGGGTTGGNVTLGANTLTVGGDNTSPAAYKGVISSDTGGGLTKIGTGTLTLAGANTYNGATIISNGTLKLVSEPQLSVTTGLSLWVDANDFQTADLVGLWSDKSGNIRDLTQGNDDNKPSSVLDAINGRPVVRFDGNDVIANGNNFGNPYSIFTVSRMEGSQNRRLITANNNWLLGFWGGNQDVMYAEGWVSADDGPDPDGNVHFYAATGDGSLTSFYDGNTLLASNNGGTAGPNGLSLGAFNNDPGNENSKGDVAEIVIYNRVLEPDERTAVVDYLNAKWGTGGGGGGAGNILPITTVVTMASDTTFDVNGATQQIAGLADASGGPTGHQVLLGKGTLTVGGDDNLSSSFSGAIHGLGGSLVKAGAGTLTLTGANDYTGVTTVTAGTLQLNGVEATTDPVAWGPVLNVGGADIQGAVGVPPLNRSKLVFDYTDGSSPALTIDGLMKASYNGGAWDGADVGDQFRSTTAAATGLTLGWKDDPGTKQVTVMATYAGDANLDGEVDGADVDIWKLNVGTTGGAGVWELADFNYDGEVDGADVDIWKLMVGSSINPSGGLSGGGMSLSASIVPEPGTLALLAAGLLGLLCYAWRKRK